MYVMSFMFGELTVLSAWLKWNFAISRKHQVRVLKEVYQVLVITTSISQDVTTLSILSNTNLNLMNNMGIIQDLAL